VPGVLADTFTSALHKSLSFFDVDAPEIVDFSGQMLDA
jgi:hypothetical protein